MARLPAHIGASLLRVPSARSSRSCPRFPLGIAMGVSPAVSAFLTPAVALLLGARGYRLDPDRDAVVRLRFRRDHLRDLQRGVLHRRPTTRCSASRPFRCTVRNAAASLGAGRMGDADRGPAAGRAAEYRHRHPHRAGLCLARADRRRDDRHQCGPRLHAVRRARFLQDRSDRARHDRHRRAVAAARSACCWRRSSAPPSSAGAWCSAHDAASPQGLEPLPAPDDALAVDRHHRAVHSVDRGLVDRHRAAGIPACIPARTGGGRALVRVARLYGHPAGVPAGQHRAPRRRVLLGHRAGHPAWTTGGPRASGRTRRCGRCCCSSRPSATSPGCRSW